ncbi:glycerophosphodiester phosphodiesterase family protein [Streptomyces sp. NPDC020379]|uniref:glycerophosphodiester phosphodiesterase family protein n=1 Tax=Streptomyces sp. NPDC020379 TaxID=3365071 RepID=UPI0037BDF462
MNHRPWIIAHRGGGADFPENTLLALKGAVEHRADMVWLSVQVSCDGVPVLYRPADLAALTEGSGKVADTPFRTLAALNAGFSFRDPAGEHPYRGVPIPLPSLEAALAAVPRAMPVILDMKTADPGATTDVLTALDGLEERGLPVWERCRFYCTERAPLTAVAAHPRARAFEARDRTRDRLAACRLTGECPSPPRSGSWVGFELHRDIELRETCTLGEGVSTVEGATMWDERTCACVRRHHRVTVVFFGINTPADYLAAQRLGADAVLSDSPRQMERLTRQGNRPEAFR